MPLRQLLFQFSFHIDHRRINPNAEFIHSFQEISIIFSVLKGCPLVPPAYWPIVDEFPKLMDRHGGFGCFSNCFPLPIL
jgi:hypothetical protein